MTPFHLLPLLCGVVSVTPTVLGLALSFEVLCRAVPAGAQIRSSATGWGLNFRGIEDPLMPSLLECSLLLKGNLCVLRAPWKLFHVSV